MFKKIALILTLALGAVILFSACERSAVSPSAPLATPTINAMETLPNEAINGTLTAVALEQLMKTGLPPTTPAAPTTIGEETTLPPTETPTPTQPPISTPTLGRPATYTLQAGEFPYCIARRFNVDPDELLALNGIGDGQIFQPGLVLKIPQTGSFPGDRALQPHPTTYTVAVNDTIYSVACKFGDVDPFYLASYNNIVAPYVLQVGKVLNIP
jgi:LysM repeat protein